MANEFITAEAFVERAAATAREMYPHADEADRKALIFATFGGKLADDDTAHEKALDELATRLEGKD
jgi:hypothetical protein